MISTEPISVSAVRSLSESEIQDRLYGSYLGKKRLPRSVEPPSPVSAAAPVPAPAKSEDSAWTGSEILTSELKRLRSELISLRREKDLLAAHLQQVQPFPASSSKETVGIGRWGGRVLGVFLLLGILGYLAGARVLQASPAVGDFTPYTVQVAVYNGRGMADQALRLLNELGYDAFLAEVPRRNGTVRWRIYVGRFVTKEEAAQESRRLAADNRFRDFKDAFVLIR